MHLNLFQLEFELKFLQHGKEEKKPIPEVPTLVIESAPDTVNHSRQQLTATVQEQSTLLAARQPDNLLAARQADNNHRTLVRTDEVTSAGGLSDLDKVVMSRKLVERLQESAGQYWINGDHIIRADDHVIRADGIRLTDSDVYSQLQKLKSHSNTFTIGSQSGTLRLRTESPGHQQSDLEVSERGLELRSESDTSRGEKRSESGERQRLKSRQQGRLLSETGRSETVRSETARKIRTDVKPDQKVSKSRVLPNSEFGDNLYHLLPSEDRYSG